MNGQTISWDESKPANTDQVGQGDDQIRSDKTALRTALNDEHNFPSTGGANSGYHRYGSARAFYGVESTVSSSGTNGRLMVSSDKSRLFHVGSDGTMLLGGAAALMGMGSDSGFTIGQTHYWAMDITGGQSSATGRITHTFATAFSGQPVVLINSISTTVNLGTVFQVWTTSATGFTAYSYLTDWATAAGTRYYTAISIGSRVLG